MKFVGVGGTFCAAHTSPEGVLHGHSYEVVVWFRHGHDARLLRKHLATVLDDLDHAHLDVWLGEDLAELIAKRLPGAVKIEVNRPLERIYAEWSA